jgi:hypothetical protein
MNKPQSPDVVIEEEQTARWDEPKAKYIIHSLVVVPLVRHFRDELRLTSKLRMPSSAQDLCIRLSIFGCYGTMVLSSVSTGTVLTVAHTS